MKKLITGIVTSIKQKGNVKHILVASPYDNDKTINKPLR